MSDPQFLYRLHQHRHAELTAAATSSRLARAARDVRRAARLRARAERLSARAATLATRGRLAVGP